MSAEAQAQVQGRAVLVTGAAGFIASHLVESLLRDGIPVVGVDNFDPFYPRAVKESGLAGLRAISAQTGTPFDFHELDINELQPGLLAQAGVGAVAHLAAKAGVRPSLENPEAYVRANVSGTMRVLEASRAAGVRDILFGSSSSVYGDDTPVPFCEDARCDRPISPYAATKRAGELLCANYCHLYGMRIAALRFFTVYGPRQRPDLAIHKFSRLIRDGKPITLFGDGSTSRDYTYVSDIIAGVRGALGWVERAGPGTYDVFNLGGHVSTPLKRLVELLERELGRKAAIEWAPRQPGDVERTFADVGKSGRELGYAPRVHIEDGVRMFAEWFRGDR